MLPAVDALGGVGRGEPLSRTARKICSRLLLLRLKLTKSRKTRGLSKGILSSGSSCRRPNSNRRNGTGLWLRRGRVVVIVDFGSVFGCSRDLDGTVLLVVCKMHLAKERALWWARRLGGLFDGRRSAHCSVVVWKRKEIEKMKEKSEERVLTA